jgi:hypothetical protein
LEHARQMHEFRELESNQRRPPSKSGFSTSTESPGIEECSVNATTPVAKRAVDQPAAQARGWRWPLLALRASVDDSPVAEAGIEPAPSTFREWLQYQH